MNWEAMIRKTTNIYNQAITKNDTRTIKHCQTLIKRYLRGEKTEELYLSMERVNVAQNG